MRAPRPKIGLGEKIRVLIVDDSVVVRSMDSRILEADAAIEVVGVARNGLDALKKVPQLRPHVVTLDVEMPELDGLGALRKIVELYPAVRVVMLSSLTARGALVTIEALTSGASDYVTKPEGAKFESGTSHAAEDLGRELIVKIKDLFLSDGCEPVRQAIAQPAPVRPVRPVFSFGNPEVFAIGVSTGGPAALAEVLPMIPAHFPLPIAIVQHMPPYFTRLLAERLSHLCQISVVEGEDGMMVEPGCAVLAPGGYHMRFVRSSTGLKVALDTEAMENSCRPAVDVLFRSLAECCKGQVIAAILTGMGQDGLNGVRLLKGLGAYVVAQDQATSTIWGMPGKIVSEDLADAVLPLNSIIPKVLARVRF